MNVGERVGDYEVVQILGAGGMGQVYKVRNVFSDRIEAMKILLPNLGGDTELVERFQREIKLQAVLDHPNIARLHTAQLVGNQLLMVMEYVEGESIESLLRRGALGMHESISCTIQVLDALAYAHGHGVVHRDIKPANIMRTPAGVAKLMDFGIARVEADRRLTQTGHAVGSLFYMSPEQIKGAQPDARSDIYSLGITLYEMVTGRRPFEGDSDFSIMAAHLEQVPMAPIEVIPGVPGEVNDIILMAIAKDPAARFQTAAAFQAALKSLDQPQGGTVVRSAAPALAASVPPPRVAPAVPPTLANPLPPTLPRQASPPQPLPQQAFAPPPVPPRYGQPVQPYQQAAPYGQPFPQPPMGAMPAPPAKSRRGLYMAVGSIATLLVLGAAIVEGPKLLRTGASNAAQQDGPVPAQTAPTAAPVQPGTPADSPSAQTNPITPEPAPTTPVQTTPVQPPPPEPVKPVRTTPAPVRQAPPPVAVQPVVSPPPVQQAPPPVQAQAPPPPAPVQTQAPPPGPSAQQMNEIRKDYNLLAIRVGSTKGGLRSIEQQMRRQGLDLRGDVLEAESRMDYQMKEAQDSLRAGDIGAARSEMQMAERALETLEKFLGR
jgi:eukaryotic-like serine/threonine-protein kinase